MIKVLAFGSKDHRQLKLPAERLNQRYFKSFLESQKSCGQFVDKNLQHSTATRWEQM
jgi:hypothetical protein